MVQVQTTVRCGGRSMTSNELGKENANMRRKLLPRLVLTLLLVSWPLVESPAASGVFPKLNHNSVAAMSHIA
jgi:hypothetical protein